MSLEADDVDDDGNALEENKSNSEGSNYRPPAKRRKEFNKKVRYFTYRNKVCGAIK